MALLPHKLQYKMTSISSILEHILSENSKLLPDAYRRIAPSFFAEIEREFGHNKAAAETSISLLSKPLSSIDNVSEHVKKIGALYISWRRADLSFENDDVVSAAMMKQSWSLNHTNTVMPIVSLMSCMLEKMDVDIESRLGSACIAAALLGDLPNPNEFHSNAHFRDITSTLFRLITAHNDMNIANKKGFLELSSDQACLMLIAASIHDFCHDGNGNALDGVHTAMRLESRSFAMAEPVLKSLGLNHDELEAVRMMILCTDVSYGDEGVSPSRVLNKCYKYFYEGADLPNISSDQYKFLEEYLLNNKQICLMAMMLEEADIFTSAGLSYDYAMLSTMLVAKETKVLKGDAATLKGFIDIICGGLLSSPVAKYMFSASFENIKEQAFSDAEDNVVFEDVS